MCKLVDAFPEPLPQAECSDYKLQHLLFFLFFSFLFFLSFFFPQVGQERKRVLSSQRKVLKNDQYIYPFHSHLLMQNFQSPAAASHIAIGMLLHPNKPPKQRGSSRSFSSRVFSSSCFKLDLYPFEACVYLYKND